MAIDDLIRERDAKVASRDAIQQNLTQKENVFAESATRPNDFKSTVQARMKSRFNDRSAAVGQIREQQQTANTAATDRLASLEGTDMSAIAKAAAAARSAASANQNVLSSEQSLNTRIGGLNDTFTTALQGIIAERDAKQAEIDALLQQYTRADSLVGEANNAVTNEEALMLERQKLARSGSPAAPRTSISIPGVGDVNLTNNELLSYLGMSGAAEPEYQSEPVYEMVQTEDPFTGQMKASYQKTGERQFYIDPQSQTKVYINEAPAQSQSLDYKALGGSIRNLMNRFTGKNDLSFLEN